MPKLSGTIQLKPSYPVITVDLSDPFLIGLCQKYRKKQEKIAMAILNQHDIDYEKLKVKSDITLEEYLWLFGVFIMWHIQVHKKTSITISLHPDTMRDPDTEEVIGLF